MKGIILAAGSGTRLYPLTLSTSKQLLPVYDKPMIYYPLATLMSFGIKDILIITAPQDKESFEKLLGDGKNYGCNFVYKIQEVPNGLAEAFIIGKDFIGSDSVCLILGDNIFHGIDFDEIKDVVTDLNGGLVFGYQVNDPERYGVVSFDNKGNAIGIQEKPKNPKSNFAVPGLYFFDNRAPEISVNVKPSDRGELEITEVINFYLVEGTLKVHKLPKGVAWLDAGTFDSLNQSGQYVQTIQERQGIIIGCIEEMAYDNRWINKEQLAKFAEKFKKNSYGNYLNKLINEE